MAINWTTFVDWAFKDLLTHTKLNDIQNNIKVTKDLIKGDNAELTDQPGHTHDGTDSLIIHPINQAYWE